MPIIVVTQTETNPTTPVGPQPTAPGAAAPGTAAAAQLADRATYRTSQGDTVDIICWRFYGQQSGAVEAVLAANPGLAAQGPVLPVNVEMVLPDLPNPASEAQPIRLWD